MRLRHAAAVGEGWRLRVLGVTRNATRRVLAVSPYDKPEPGGQDYLIRVAATYVGGGKSYFGGPLGLRDRIKALGRRGAVYDYSNDRCGEDLPRPDIENSFARTFSGRAVLGNICFQIASNDARALRLFVAGPLSLRTLARGRQVWFALP